MRIFVLTLLLTVTLAVHADDSESPAERAALSPAESGNPLPTRDDQWRFTIAFPMIWTPDINGTIRNGEQIEFTIPFDDILDSLSFGFMFELYANRGPYGLAFRSNYMRVDDENSRSGILDTRIETTLDMGVNDRNYGGDFRALYRINDLHNFWFGYRYLKIGNDSTEDGITYEVDMDQQGLTLGWAFTF